eukprot:TRINITY_DN1529_c0_g1_i1.p4 TRINITY_DN1529_c0_g1~~TRINITY_DN1529_c0_g1_i1.p4  ORF type:complete len:108 (+),score=31.74 TRINITY_DN1529_c0_g1_i1:655-978(+)
MDPSFHIYFPLPDLYPLFHQPLQTDPLSIVQGPSSTDSGSSNQGLSYQNGFYVFKASKIQSFSTSGILSIGFAKVVGGICYFLTSSCLLYTSPSPRDKRQSRMPSSA